MNARVENMAARAHEDLEAALERFEQSWRSGRPPRIEDALVRANADTAEDGRELLHELVAVDLEYRWRSHNRRGPLLEQYVKRLPQLPALDQLPYEFIVEEYHVRQRFGDEPTHAEYAARFPRHGQQLLSALAAVDADLCREYSESKHRDRKTSQSTSSITDPQAPLDYRDLAIRRLLGRGGMSRVYTAVQKSTGEAVALKVLNKSRLSSDRAVRRFLREARIAAELDGPGVVGAHGVGRFPDGGYFTVLRLVDGGDLSRAGAVPMNIARATQIVAELARVVDRVHQDGYLHCDLKPSNVLLDSHERVWLTDFAMAQPLGDGRGDAESVLALGGTYAYMAQEQFAGETALLSPTTDVFGLGGVLYFLLTGDAPRAVPSQTDQLDCLPPPDLEKLASIPPSLRSIVRKCLAQSCAERFASPLDVARALETTDNCA